MHKKDYPERSNVNATGDEPVQYTCNCACSGLTIFKRALEHVVRHTTRSHRHVGYDVEGVIASWLQIVNNVSGCIVSNDCLIFLIV